MSSIHKKSIHFSNRSSKYMENNFLEQICFDLQFDDQMLDEISQMYVQNSGVQSINNEYNNNTNQSHLDSKSAEDMEMEQYYQNSSDFHSVPRLNQSVIDKCSNSREEHFTDIEKSKIKINAKIDDYCMRIIRDMNTVGVCLIDHFMEELGEYILQEVIHLYQTVVFSDGKVVNNNRVCDINNEKIRGDSIYWVNGSEPNSKFIGILMTTLDKIIFKCNKMNNNGLMGINTISSRTSAMIACYPGQESSYKQHADNTIGDGRYITCIYYINKCWDPINDGGILRLYPFQVANHQPLNIAPEFDRLICFWSDRRNLHEVLPTKRLRFAITVWYFDEEERKRFRQRISSNPFPEKYNPIKVDVLPFTANSAPPKSPFYSNIERSDDYLPPSQLNLRKNEVLVDNSFTARTSPFAAILDLTCLLL